MNDDEEQNDREKKTQCLERKIKLDIFRFIIQQKKLNAKSNS